MISSSEGNPSDTSHVEKEAQDAADAMPANDDDEQAPLVADPVEGLADDTAMLRADPLGHEGRRIRGCVTGCRSSRLDRACESAHQGQRYAWRAIAMAAFTDAEIAYLRSQPLRRFATASLDGRPDVAPVVFEVDGDDIVTSGSHPRSSSAGASTTPRPGSRPWSGGSSSASASSVAAW